MYTCDDASDSYVLENASAILIQLRAPQPSKQPAYRDNPHSILFPCKSNQYIQVHLDLGNKEGGVQSRLESHREDDAWVLTVQGHGPKVFLKLARQDLGGGGEADGVLSKGGEFGRGD